MTSSGLEKLEAWRKSKDFAVFIYREIIPLFPPDEKFNLSSQIRRAASSIPANIAEGYGRFYYQANIQFCYNARGSLEELLSHLILAHELRFITEIKFKEAVENGNRLDLLINGYISYLKKTKQGERDFSSTYSAKDGFSDYTVGDAAQSSINGFDDSRFSDLDSRS